MRESEREPTDFNGIVNLIASSGADVVLIGGVAISMHGGDYNTIDVDFVYRREARTIQILIDTLAPLRPRPVSFGASQNFKLTSDFLSKAKFATLKCALGRIDLLSEPGGIESFDSLYERADVVPIESGYVRVASIDDLIAMKKAAGRPKDTAAIFELETLRTLREEQAETEN